VGKYAAAFEFGFVAGHDFLIDDGVFGIEAVVLERIKVSRSYTGVLEATNREINDRIIELVCVNCGVNEKWLREGTGKMFKEKPYSRLDRVMWNFEKLDDYLQEYVIKQLDILLECQERNKAKSNTYIYINNLPPVCLKWGLSRLE
jgi:hypothetical protein